jgi:hypothetical protein
METTVDPETGVTPGSIDAEIGDKKEMADVTEPVIFVDVTCSGRFENTPEPTLHTRDESESQAEETETEWPAWADKECRLAPKDLPSTVVDIQAVEGRQPGVNNTVTGAFAENRNAETAPWTPTDALKILFALTDWELLIFKDESPFQNVAETADLPTSAEAE